MNGPIHAAVSQLLSEAYRLPCSTAAGAFARLVPSTSRFQLALDELFPLLTHSQPATSSTKSFQSDWQHALATRILASYILYALYAPHPMSINPFREALLSTFVTERAKLGPTGSTGGNEQLVWVLWKILRGDGNDIGPFSPSTLASSPLPPKLRAAQLSLDDEISSPPTSPSPSPSPSAQEEAQALSLLLASRFRVLSLSEIRVLTPHLQSILRSSVLVPTQDLPSIIANNSSASSLSLPITKFLLSSSNDLMKSEVETVLTTLLPPTLNTFDLWGRLLKDQDLASSYPSLRQSLLPLFLTNCISSLSEWEKDKEEDGGQRWERGVVLFCRFVLSLIKGGVMMDLDMTELTHFALSHSRLDDAREVYGLLVSGRLD